VNTARKRSAINPRCWDFNDTVDSRVATCRLEDGTVKDYCLEFAFATNAFVMECRGEYFYDMTCGTYVELHKEGENITSPRATVQIFASQAVSAMYLYE